MQISKLFYQILISLLLIPAGCNRPGTESRGEKDIIPKGNLFAKKFEVESYNGFSILKVFSPWQNAEEAAFRYTLVEDPDVLPDSLRREPYIQIPVKKVVIMSTTFLPLIDKLGGFETIKGVSGVQNYFNPAIRHKVDQGDIRDVGFDQRLNYELLVDLQPDVVFMFGVQPGIVKHIDRLEELGIKVVLVADYLEPHPLGRAEWIRFFSCFYDKQQEAAAFYHDIVNNYDSIQRIALSFKEKPQVMIGLPWKDSWHVPQGNSFAAKLIEDAGGIYIWSDLEGSEAIAMGIEKVFYRAMEADIWINAGVAENKRMLLEHDTRFKRLPAFENDMIFNNNKRLGNGGGNDYWESGPLRPDLILSDLQKIFQHETISKMDLYYYKKLD